jgi:hypothetical protein
MSSTVSFGLCIILAVAVAVASILRIELIRNRLLGADTIVRKLSFVTSISDIFSLDGNRNL